MLINNVAICNQIAHVINLEIFYGTLSIYLFWWECTYENENVRNIHTKYLRNGQTSKKLGSRVTINPYRKLFWCEFVLIVIFFFSPMTHFKFNSKKLLDQKWLQSTTHWNKKYFHCLVSFFLILFSKQNPFHKQ